VWCIPRHSFDRALDEMGAKFVQGMSFVRSKVTYSRRGMWLLGDQEIDSLYCDGLPKKLMSELANTLKSVPEDSIILNTFVRSMKLGVSVHYVSTQFECDLAEALPDKDDIGRLTFHNLRDVFWPTDISLHDAPGFRGCMETLCPRDNKRGCSIVDALDLLELGYAGEATHFLSWCWRYSIKDFVSALSRKEGLYLWVCFFCNNQRDIILEKEGHDPKTSLANIFDQRLMTISGHVIALLDDFENPSYASRIWCIYEIFRCSMLEMNVEVIFPERLREEIATEITEGHFKKLAKGIETIDSERAEAWNKKDEETIKDIIRSSSLSFSGINTVVKSSLRDGIGAVFADLLDEERQERRRSKEEKVELLERGLVSEGRRWLHTSTSI
jgi:hypothetical protein